LVSLKKSLYKYLLIYNYKNLICYCLLDDNDSDDEKSDEDKYADDMVPGHKLHLESKQRISVRNLRMREDTAKYLLNLDPNSAYYDPKSRSMRDNPFTDKEASNVPYVGDNYVRYSGQANQFAKTQIFAWDASEKGVEVHTQADPTKLELLHREYKQRYEEAAKNIKEAVLEKYGGAEHIDNALPKELIFSQTENYVEYNRFGNVISGQEKANVRSKYVEDEFINNHKSVWGSYFDQFKWGYKCCHSMDRHSYCKGFKTDNSNQQTLDEKDNVIANKASSNDIKEERQSIGVE
jgi:pre-mRNA-processing factor SLU7